LSFVIYYAHLFLRKDAFTLYDGKYGCKEIFKNIKPLLLLFPASSEQRQHVKDSSLEVPAVFYQEDKKYDDQNNDYEGYDPYPCFFEKMHSEDYSICSL